MSLPDKTSISGITSCGFTDQYSNYRYETRKLHIVLKTEDDGAHFKILSKKDCSESHTIPANCSFVLSHGSIPAEVLEMVRKAYRSGVSEYIKLDGNKINGHRDSVAEYDIVKLDSAKVLLICSERKWSLKGNGQQNRKVKDSACVHDMLPIGLFSITPDGTLLYVNEWLVEFLGYISINELMGVNFAKLIANDKKNRSLRKRISALTNGKEKEIHLRKKDNTLQLFRVRLSPVSINDSGMEFYMGYLFSITEQNKAQEQLIDVVTMFNTISGNIRTAIYMFNSEGRFLFSNPAMEEITGYNHDELSGMRFYDLVSEEFIETVKKRGLNRLEEKNDIPERYELKIVTKSGNEKWVEIHAARLIHKGDPVVMGLGYDISERIVALDKTNAIKEDFKALNSFFRMMVDNVPDMIWAKDLNKKYIFANKAVCENLLMANDTNEPIGKTDAFFSERERKKHPDNPQWFTFWEISPDSDDVVLRTKKPEQFDEYGNVRGEYLYLDVHKAPLYDDSGKLVGIVGSARDVTVTRRIEAEREKEEKIKNLVYRIGNAVNTTKDLSELFSVIRMELSQIIDTSNLFIALYNKANEELSLPYFVDEKDRFKRIPAGKTVTRYMIHKKAPVLLKEKDLLHLAEKDEIDLIGSMAKVWLGVPLVAKSEIIGALVVQNYHNEDAFGADELNLLEFISIQIGISISQKMADDAIRENEFTLRQIIDNIPVMVYAKDRNLRYIFVNQELADAYGRRTHDIEGRLQTEVHDCKDEVVQFEKDDLEVLRSGKDMVISEEAFTGKNGERKILKTIKIPMRNGNEKGIALLGVSIDITERINFEDQLKRAKNKAEESDRLKTAFLANMSHEIRTPMNAIVGFSELLNDRELTPETRSEFVDLIGLNSMALLKLIEDIIDIAKIEADQIKIIKGACQVNRIMGGLESHYNEYIGKLQGKKIQIKTKKAMSDPGFAIETDPLRLRQVLDNLIGNAIKFTEKGVVEFGYYLKDSPWIVFYVKDTGIGLAPEKKSLIFERFRQAEESSTKEYGGTGLGLTISRRLVEIMGGSIWVDSVLGEGSTFYFSLPFKNLEVHPKVESQITDVKGIDWSDKTILVAEDEPSNFELLKAILEKTKAHIIYARDGQEATDMVKATNNDFDLVLMDIRMPVMDGYEATEEIKVLKPDLPVISISAYAMPEDKEKSRLAGCDEHISKPFHPGRLLNKLADYI